ncbi:MAG: hypothetical protein DPW09_27635 [Anaerolineae bacterium]|nr:SUMF1/EgtB/PvdO family nonheme iron enzyme [Anaerolineales bacterium]MCQ3977218.1 hypothetical protein [Anaerolineae bacterium]
MGPGRGHRVLRGGAFNNEANNVRCAARNRNNPNNRNNNNGFRVVLPHNFQQGLGLAMWCGYGCAAEILENWRACALAAP